MMNSAAEYEAGRLFCGHWDGILGDGWEMVGNAANFMTKNMWIYIYIFGSYDDGFCRLISCVPMQMTTRDNR